MSYQWIVRGVSSDVTLYVWKENLTCGTNFTLWSRSSNIEHQQGASENSPKKNMKHHAHLWLAAVIHQLTDFHVWGRVNMKHQWGLTLKRSKPVGGENLLSMNQYTIFSRDWLLYPKIFYDKFILIDIIIFYISFFLLI